MWTSLIDILPRGNTLDEADWQRRHSLLQWVLLAHVPVLAVIGFALGNPALPLLLALTIPVLCAGAGRLLRHHRRWGSGFVSAGLVWCSTALVGITNGTIEAHFHFFIIIGFIALYQDWVPFLLNVVFTVITHGVGSMWLRTLMFNHPEAQANPWLWSLIHGVAVLLACIGVMLFWRVTEDEQTQKDDLTRKLADAEIGRRRFTSDMLVNLARRNQSMLYRQLEIINQLEESERNPDALAELFRLDHLTTRVRRNAENLLVLSGEKPPRVWSQPVPLRDVVRAAIAETEDLDRVAFEIPEGPLVDGASVTDLTHLLAELTENAVRFSPPDMAVTIRGRRDPRGGQGQLLTVEDWGVGIDEDDLASANALLANPPEVDLSVSKRLGFHVVARLAARHGIRVALSPTPGSGITASLSLPGTLFELGAEPVGALVPAAPAAARPGRPAPRRRAGFDRAALERADADRAASERPVPERPAHERTGPDRTGFERTAAERPGFDRVAAELAPSDRAGFDRAGSDRPVPHRSGFEYAGAADRAGGDRATGEHGADVRPLIPNPRLPLPAETAGPAPVGPDGMPWSWTGWWAGPGPDTALTGAAVGVPTPRAIPRVDQMVDQHIEAPPRRIAAVPDGPAIDDTTEITTTTAVAQAEATADTALATGTTPAGEAVPATGTTPADESASTVNATGGLRPTLRRRVPQAHLAPGLRVVTPTAETATAADPGPLPVAAEALSRYQASRAAARSVVDGGSTAADERSSQ
jgi:signal transduction histidine kinase